ncbi:hypothetical protein QSE00_03695 [Arenibacter sp. M-2]|uniref:hypothetical protein n=1 Tax=Arenibacter sp. M-2 TaxID=3053612 RepID=UPI00256FBD49|nr:hypothetical protein [Arenibacter sp. M-2]MDL5510902.1 hypothetical protein [Arenibacter sp. M-2]
MYLIDCRAKYIGLFIISGMYIYFITKTPRGCIKILSAKSKKISIINSAYTCNLLNFSYLVLEYQRVVFSFGYQLPLRFLIMGMEVQKSLVQFGTYLSWQAGKNIGKWFEIKNSKRA